MSNHEVVYFLIYRCYPALKFGQELFLLQSRYMQSQVAIGTDQQDAAMVRSEFVAELLFEIDKCCCVDFACNCLCTLLENDIQLDCLSRQLLDPVKQVDNVLLIPVGI